MSEVHGFSDPEASCHVRNFSVPKETREKIELVHTAADEEESILSST